MVKQAQNTTCDELGCHSLREQVRQLSFPHCSTLGCDPVLCREQPSMERVLWAFMILHLCTTFSRNVPSVNSLIEKAKWRQSSVETREF